MGEQLKDCPFCGGKAEIKTNQDGNIFQIVCPSCHAHSLWSINAVELWNNRTRKDTSLLPCPICGNKGKLRREYDEELHDDFFCVQCSHCGLTSVAYIYPNSAKSAWNRRPDDYV